MGKIWIDGRAAVAKAGIDVLQLNWVDDPKFVRSIGLLLQTALIDALTMRYDKSDMIFRLLPSFWLLSSQTIKLRY